MPLKDMFAILMGQAAIVPFAKPAFELMRQAHERALDRLDEVINECERKGETIEIKERDLT